MKNVSHELSKTVGQIQARPLALNQNIFMLVNAHLHWQRFWGKMSLIMPRKYPYRTCRGLGYKKYRFIFICVAYKAKASRAAYLRDTIKDIFAQNLCQCKCALTNIKMFSKCSGSTLFVVSTRYGHILADRMNDSTYGLQALD
jgi:hypothetical protein